MTKTGFKPEWTAFHDDCSRQFEKYLKSSPKDDVVDHVMFVRWAYGVKC